MKQGKTITGLGELRRGKTYAGGGRYVGTSKGRVLWICYGTEEDFRKMCELFDRTQK